MATLEDKILGNKLHNYCSSSEDEDELDNSDTESSKQPPKSQETLSHPPEVDAWEGTSTNTGPKGVIKDWQRYKQLEIEKRAEDEREKIELLQKLTLTVQSALDEEREKAALVDPDIAELMDDAFLLDYQKHRMEEMLEQVNHKIKFGHVISLSTGQDFLDAIDKENKSVKVIVHIYENNVDSCRVMNNCLAKLCKMYPNVKFCSIVSSKAGMTSKFKSDGVPALLVYKAGNLIGNFVKLADELGSEFSTEEVQDFLVEHGMLEDKSCKPIIVRSHSDSEDSE
ncbi:phosducin-like protein [Coccinella septempunctata]|uniref:phosducin-like protein n=1 Tax=Coccinella septempunctata TaxID=41139 RepID=UPI001D08FA71|nr:phosducin-like protein [Coccinella septempunctata]